MSNAIDTGSKEHRDAVHGLAVKVLGTPTLSVGAEDTNAIPVTIQLKDQTGTNLAAKCRATVWLSATAAATTTGLTAPNGTVSFTTGTLLKEVTTKVMWEVVTDATGKLVLSIGDSGTPTFYVNVAVGAVIASSAAVTFAS
jgi:hypothetical protein